MKKTFNFVSLTSSAFITSAQLYYIHEVLGVESVISPPQVRAGCQLYEFGAEPDFLFFGRGFHIVQQAAVKKIDQALLSTGGVMADVQNLKAGAGGRVFKNLCMRFSPRRGVVVFGADLAAELKILNKDLKDKYVLNIESLSFTVCLVHALEDLTLTKGQPSQNILQNKTQTWQKLKTCFLS